MCPKQENKSAVTGRAVCSASSSSRVILLVLTLAILALCALVSTLDTDSKREEARLFLRSCHNLVLHVAGLLFPDDGKEAYGSRIRRAFFPRPSPGGHSSASSSSGSGGASFQSKYSSTGAEGTGASLSHPAQDVLVDVTGDASKRSRMGRACLIPAEEQVGVVGATNGDEVQNEDNREYVELVEALASVSMEEEREGPGESAEEAAVEIRPNGAIMPRMHQSSFSPWTLKHAAADKTRIQNGEPVVGMTIQVYPLDWVDDEAKYLNEESASPTSPYALGRINGGDGKGLQRSLACVSSNYVGSSSDTIIEYQLEKRMKSRLGLVDTHTHDYMYKPVLSLPDGGDGSTFESGEDEIKRKWRGPSDDSQAPPYHERYEWMDDHAFAGGSHGEVWHARRRCPKRGRSRRDGGLDSCNDQRKLIMKRLKVEHGYDLLEAGLREVYFGELLSQAKDAEGFFTSYIDHFFREVPASLRGSSRKRHVELWIVFEDAGPSLRSYIYSPVSSTGGDFIVYQHSSFWRRLRRGVAASRGGHGGSQALSIIMENEQKQYSSALHRNPRPFSTRNGGQNTTADVEGKTLIRDVLEQVLTAAAFLHSNGIVHRDIKPSNIMCTVKRETAFNRLDPFDREVRSVDCRVGDFSSAVDKFTSSNMYTSTKGPSAAEQTNEYSPPEALFGPSSTFDPIRPQSYDSWSIGVVALELLLGTPNVFSVDQRTKAVLTNKMQKQGASEEEIQRALYLAALSNFCIFIPSDGDKEMRWPLQPGGPLHDASMVRKQCGLHDFHAALRARDPLGLGFDSSSDQLLLLILGLLHWDPMKRLSASEALLHPYFRGLDSSNTEESSLEGGEHNALEPQAFGGPRVKSDGSAPDISEFFCPKCGKKFEDHNSCQQHARSRRHANFCAYDHRRLPPCLNAHSMLPAHPDSGYCDIQGRRPTIEDFHTVHIHPKHLFLGVFDGHNGNLASKYAAASFYDQLVERMSDLDHNVTNGDGSWKVQVEYEMLAAFEDLHTGILGAIDRSPEDVMKSTGTTATVLFTTDKALVLANVGDSRAILSNGTSAPIQLSIDHVASNGAEQDRIKSLGGFVESIGGTPRVNGTLAVSRSLGDAHLASLLSREPHVVAMSKGEIQNHCRSTSSTTSGDPNSPSYCFMVIACEYIPMIHCHGFAMNVALSLSILHFPTHLNCYYICSRWTLGCNEQPGGK